MGDSGSPDHHAPQASEEWDGEENYDGGYEATGNLNRTSANDKTQLVDSEAERESGGHCSCLTCLARVPCGSLIAWIMMVVGLGAFAASTYIAVLRTRDLLQKPYFLSYFHFILIGICAVTFPLCTLMLIVGHLSSGRTSREALGSSRKNVVGRTLNVLMLILCYILHIAWLIILCVLVVPNLAVLVLYYLVKVRTVNCIDLNTFLFAAGLIKDQGKAWEYCNEGGGERKLDGFFDDTVQVWICYAASFIAAFLVILSLVHFLICIGGNYKHLKELRASTYKAYTEELRKSTDSLPLETKL